MKYINVSEYATERDLLDGYDDELDTKILDDDALIGEIYFVINIDQTYKLVIMLQCDFL